jgi:FkbM family methyltransferase
MNEIRVFEGREWLWPTADYHCWKHLTIDHPTIPEDILNEIGRVFTVVQAGGNCGLYTAQYAKYAQHVITFEPEPNNYLCLENNITEDNVSMFEAALGERERTIGLKVDPINSGATRVINDGDIKQVRLDDYGLEPDLIHLDIEGHEPHALNGMLDTLKKCHPAVALERGNGEEILFKLGYSRVKQFGLDWLYL